MIIVTGCGRSGTYYIYLVLRELGFNLGHEEWGAEGQVGFHAAVELRGAKMKRRWRDKASDDDIVLHQVRHPLGCISSFQTAKDYSWEYVFPYIDSSMDDSLTLRCMKYWYYWNRMAERHAKLTYSVERLPEVWPEICKLLSIPAGTPLPKETSKGWHTRGHTTLTWDDLRAADKDMCRKIKKLGRKYGYEIG